MAYKPPIVVHFKTKFYAPPNGNNVLFDTSYEPGDGTQVYLEDVQSSIFSKSSTYSRISIAEYIHASIVDHSHVIERIDKRETIQSIILISSSGISRIATEEHGNSNVQSSSVVTERLGFMEQIGNNIRFSSSVSERIAIKEDPSSVSFASSFVVEQCAFIEHIETLMHANSLVFDRMIGTGTAKEEVISVIFSSSFVKESVPGRLTEIVISPIVVTSNVFDRIEFAHIPDSGTEVNYILKIADEINFRLGVSDSVTYNRMKTGDAFSFTLKIGGE